jgi:CheY-like chemotaxis protein
MPERTIIVTTNPPFRGRYLPEPAIIVTTPQPTILIIDDDLTLGRSLKRLAELSFPEHQILWARNGVTGLDMVRQHVDQLRLVILDINMPLMDGNLTAAQIRLLAPTVPVMPFTSYAESLPALSEMGCVPPAMKHPNVLRQMPERMRQAMAMTIPILPDRAWIAALQQSAEAVLSFVTQGEIAGVLATDREAAERVKRALGWLDKYCGRFATPAREVIQARRLLEEAGIG